MFGVEQKAEPINVRPREEVEAERLRELADGIEESARRGTTIPVAWVFEYNHLTEAREKIERPIKGELKETRLC